LIETIKNAWKIPELRAKIIFTLVIVVLYRLGAAVPVPYIDQNMLGEAFKNASETIFGYLNILSGNAFSRATLFALSISPYITSSIVMQLLTVAIPALEKLQKEGDSGRKKINQITRYLTVVLGLITGYGYYIYCRNINLLTPEGSTLFGGIIIVACYSAGSALIMWLGEKINEHGIGNGISMILFANIISVLPTYIVSSGQAIWHALSIDIGAVILELIKIAAIAVAAYVVVAFVVFMSNAERRIPIQYAKRVVGRKMYGGHSTFLPIKVNMSGVMPIIFASSISSIPVTILSFMYTQDKLNTNVIYNLFSQRSVLYMALMFIMIIAFSFFYISISFNPLEVSNNLKKNGGLIPGIRQGKPTTDYISKILNKIVLIGGLFLAIIAVLPLAVNGIYSAITGSMSGAALAFGGSSLLIVVGVALETTRAIEAQMTMRNYKGFLE